MDDPTGTIMTIDPKASPETSPSDTNDLMRKKLKRKLVCAGSLDQVSNNIFIHNTILIKNELKYE